MLTKRAEDRIAEAVTLAERFGGIDGGHHKQWVIDQMLRALLGDEYPAWAARMTTGPNGEPDYYGPWETGTPP